MWKLKIAEGGSPWLRTVNNHVGRQVWEFDPKLGSPEDLLEIEKARQNFHDNRFTHKHSADLLMRIHVCLLLSLCSLALFSFACSVSNCQLFHFIICERVLLLFYNIHVISICLLRLSALLRGGGYILIL